MSTYIPALFSMMPQNLCSSVHTLGWCTKSNHPPTKPIKAHGGYSEIYFPCDGNTFCGV